MIIYRYITKEVCITFLATIFILVFVALSNQLGYLLTQTAKGQLSVNLAFKILGLYIPELFAHISPLALFISFIISLGRMYADTEMVVLYSCGFRWLDIFKSVFTIAVLFCILIASFTLWIVPKAALSREKAFSEGEAVGVIQSITPGRFQPLGDGKLVFYVEDKLNDNSLEKVFIAEQPEIDSKPWTIITAKNATVNKNDDKENFYLILKEGFRFTGIPGERNYTKVEFSEYGREIVKEETEEVDYDRVKPTSKIFNSDELGDRAELQWRVSIPISILILSIIAISLAKINPRQGRFAKIIPALLIYILYFNLITLSKRWVAIGKIPEIIGIWWVHITFLLLGILLLLKESGKLYKFYYYFVKSNN